MTRATLRYRPSGFALGLIALSMTGGCAHFRNAETRAALERGGPQPPVREVAQAEAASPPPVAREAPAALPAPDNPVRQSMREPAPPPIPAPQPVRAAPDGPTTGPPPPATEHAIIIYANTPAAQCGTCDTLKISVAPSGQVLVERGEWAARNWRYRRTMAQVGPARAAAFAASLSGDRPTGTRLLAACPGETPADNGLVIEWIEAERHDTLKLPSRCLASPATDRIRHAPELLGLRGLVWPTGSRSK